MLTMGERSLSRQQSLSTISVSVSGALNGELVLQNVSFCGIVNDKYDLDTLTTLDGVKYAFSIFGSYHGPDTYNTGPNTGLWVQISNGNGNWWTNTTGGSGQVTINSDGQSGTVSSTLAGVATNTSVHVEGSWTC